MEHTVSLTLPNELHQKLTAVADACGISVPDLLRASAREMLLDPRPTYLTKKEVCALARRSAGTVTAWMKRKKNAIPHVRIGRNALFKETEVRVWLNDQR